MARSAVPTQFEESSWTPTQSKPRISAQMPASLSSKGVLGAINVGDLRPARVARGGGRALRSTLPLGASGSAASHTNADGIMYLGRLAASAWRRTAAAGAG